MYIHLYHCVRSKLKQPTEYYYTGELIYIRYYGELDHVRITLLPISVLSAFNPMLLTLSRGSLPA